MPGVLLLGSPNVSWRDWLRQNRDGRNLLVADPADATLGAPGRIGLWREDKLIAWRFFGGLSAVRAPHLVLASIIELLRCSDSEPIIQLFPYRPGPLLRQLALLVAEVVKPSRILLSKDVQIDIGDWPVGPEEVELEGAFPPMVQLAQRRAQWLKLIEDCGEHEVVLRNLTIEGARLGSGSPLSENERREMGIEAAMHAEVCGSTLLLISDNPVSDEKVSQALDSTHTAKVQVVDPARYQRLLCSFARTGGEDFGMGFLESVDFERGTCRVLSTAVAPTPVQVLRIGGLRVSSDGQELGEIRPWEV